MCGQKGGVVLCGMKSSYINAPRASRARSPLWLYTEQELVGPCFNPYCWEGMNYYKLQLLNLAPLPL